MTGKYLLMYIILLSPGNKAQAQLLSVLLGLCQSHEGNHTAVLQCQHAVTGALPLESRALVCPGVISRTGSAKHN